MMPRIFLSITSIIGFLVTSSFAQTSPNKVIEKSKGTWIVPITKYTRVIDNEERKRQHTYGREDSSLTFVTDSSYDVTVVFPGKVIAIFPIENSFHVMVKYGDYYMTYSNITKPPFEVGDSVQSGQVLGRVAEADPKEYFLTFILMRSKKDIGAINWFNWGKRRITPASMQ